MPRPIKSPLYQRNGVFYVRINGNRWSTETTDPLEAAKRYQFMRMKNKPWKELKSEFGTRVEIVIDNEGNTHSKLLQYYSDPNANTVEQFEKSKTLMIKPVADPIAALMAATAGDTVQKKSSEEPPKDCKDLFRLLDYEHRMRELAGKPETTMEYYRVRFDALKRYISLFKLDLNSFTKMRALEYPHHRLNETVRNKGQLGFNNRAATAPTVNKEIALFKAIWGTWKDEGRVQENAWTRVEPLKQETGDISEIQEEQTYTLEEVQKILNNVDKEIIRDILFFQAMIGSRPGLEVLQLSREMIDAGKIYNFKKRRWDNFTYSPQAKKFFTDHLSGKMMGINSHHIHQEFVAACQRAGVRIGKPYDLRKVFATEALTDFKIETIQQLLRHRNLHTTRKSYAKTRYEESAAAANTMQKRIFRKLAV